MWVYTFDTRPVIPAGSASDLFVGNLSVLNQEGQDTMPDASGIKTTHPVAFGNGAQTHTT